MAGRPPDTTSGPHIDDLGDDDTPERDALTGVGQVLRRARGERFSIEELGRRAGVSPGLISQVERGLGNPSFRSLHKLANALGLRVGDLLDGDGAEERRRVVRADQRRTMGVGALTYELLVPDLNGQLEVLLTTLPQGFDNREHPFAHHGEECVVVLEGAIDVWVGSESWTLESGDAITYHAAVPHWYRNDHDHPARVLGVVTPPSF